MRKYQVIKRPLITEKGTAGQALNKYSFAVDTRASKFDVRDAVESIFKVTVKEVRTMCCPSKFKRVGKNLGRTSEWKKAIVTVKEGDRIEYLET